jgi:hypothetical protein
MGSPIDKSNQYRTQCFKNDAKSSLPPVSLLTDASILEASGIILSPGPMMVRIAADRIVVEMILPAPME